MHTAHISKLRFAIQDFYEDDDSDWLYRNYDVLSRNGLDPHAFEHEDRASELRESGDEDGAMIHELLGTNIMRAARDIN